jgi:hypothetical protein
LKIADDVLIAEWQEKKEAGKAGKIMKKIRFPLKFEYLNSKVRFFINKPKV